MKQMSERGDAATVRRLPDGVLQPVRVENGARHQLLITPLHEETTRQLEAGALLEIQSPEAIYLGVVLRRQDSRMVIAVEHTVNRAALAEIEEAWRSPQEG